VDRARRVTKKDVLQIKIDQSGQVPGHDVPARDDPDYGSTRAIIRFYHKTKKVKISTRSEVRQATAERDRVGDIVNDGDRRGHPFVRDAESRRTGRVDR
jgi:hypothetical protein